MDQAQGCADVAVAQTREPPFGFFRERLDMQAEHFDEHQLAQFGEDRFGSRTAAASFRNRVEEEVRYPALAILGPARAKDRRQRQEERIEWPE